VKCDAKETCWIVQLKATVDGSLLANEFLDFKQLDLKADKTPEILYGELLIELGEFTRARRFFQGLVKYQRTADIYYYLGRICTMLGEYDRSAMFFGLALSKLQNDPHPNSINMARVLRGIGLLYGYRGDFVRAEET
jgi:tetratricopeptide (TPR) repeat protein